MKELKMIGVSLPKTATNTIPKDSQLVELLNVVKNQYPTLCGNKIVLPTVENKDYSVSLYGSGNTAVIGNDLTVTQPLEDVTVNLFYRVTNNKTGESLETDDPITVKVVGMYDQCRVNRPDVLPAIREWKADEGLFEFSGRIITDNTVLVETVPQVIDYIGGNLADNGSATVGDIVLKLDSCLPLGEEGYFIEISDIVTLSSKTSKGIVYGAATIAQIMMQSQSKAGMPKGLIRDYPQYPFRGFMIDAARYHMDITYLEEVCKYAAFFKMNVVHLHLNDGDGEAHTSFRIKSDKYPALNRAYIDACENGDGKLYTKSDYIAFQKSVMKYGIDVVSEIDSPSHCGALGNASASIEAKNLGFEDVALNHWQLDLRGDKFEKTVDFVKSVFEEFIDPQKPVFLSKYVHIGTDEWVRDNWAKEFNCNQYGITISERNELMRRYMDTMIKFINSKGYTPVLWNGMNKDGKHYDGETPVSNNAIFQTWALSYSDIEVAFKNEYSIINSNDNDLYIVPGVDYYKTDLDIKSMYNDWHAGYFTTKEKNPDGTLQQDESVPQGHPLLLGAETAFWLDASCASSHIDLFKLLKNQIVLICEKTWYGTKTEGQTAEQYMNRVKTLANFAPTANPGRYLPYNTNGIIAQGDVKSLGIMTVPDPYTVEFGLKVDSNNGDSTVLFESTDGVVYINFEGTGNIAFKRKGYIYCFEHPIPTDKMMNFKIGCDGKDTYLFIDGVFVCKATYVRGEYEYDAAEIRRLHTLQFPLQKIGDNFKGEITDITVRNTFSSIISTT